MQHLQVRQSFSFYLIDYFFSIVVNGHWLIWWLHWSISDRFSSVIILLGSKGVIFSIFPFVMSVENSSFEEKRVFIASKMFESFAWRLTRMTLDLTTHFFSPTLRSEFLIDQYCRILFPSPRYKCHKECVPNAPSSCGFSEGKFKRALDNADIQNALGK